MSEENNRVSDAKKRTKTMKRLIILILIISIVTCIGCVLLFLKVHALNDVLQATNTQLDKMNELLLEQQSMLEELGKETDAQKQTSQTPIEDAESGISEEDKAENQATTDIVNIEAEHKVYLTFDDGPSIYTEKILDILDQYDIKATFFVLGKEDDASKELLQKIVEKGHTLGMHSYSHKYKEIYESVDSFSTDFKKIQDYLYDVTGVKSTIYRFPGGSSNGISDIPMSEFGKYLEEQGVTFYDWNISSGDGGSVQLSTQDLLNNCTNNIENFNTSIILLHDSGEKKSTIEALPTIIETILAMEDTVILPITEDTEPVQHINIHTEVEEGMEE